VGVDLINSSLGYNEFDDVKLNYTYQNMDGKTTIATRAADWAAATGIVICVAAGNDGTKTWKYIATPADADSVLAVGAVTSTELKASFSSFGPSADGRIKPDLMAMGQSAIVINATGVVTNSNGTSFASPSLCGMAACYWQQNPSLTAMQVIANLRKAGNRYTTPTPEYGYGIPFGTIINTTTPEILGNEPTETNFFQVSPNPFQESINLTLASYEGKPYQLVLMNVLGNTLWSGTLSSSSMTIPTENLQKGIYFLRVMNEEQAGIMKLVAW
jgi:serine protease AprX